MINNPKVVVELSGGLVQDILSESELDVYLVDYDVDETPDDDGIVELKENKRAALSLWELRGGTDPHVKDFIKFVKTKYEELLGQEEKEQEFKGDNHALRGIGTGL